VRQQTDGGRLAPDKGAHGDDDDDDRHGVGFVAGEEAHSARKTVFGVPCLSSSQPARKPDDLAEDGHGDGRGGLALALAEEDGNEPDGGEKGEIPISRGRAGENEG